CVTEDDDSPHLDVAGLAGALYVAIGGEDRASSAEDNRPLTGAVSALGDRGAVDVLAGADHGFAVPGPRYHPAAAEQAYGRALAIFDEAIR
ncbi:MAG TPA: dienelactone hydrolase family protein, partial [Acidimicrobiales bacterium]|nr:dienelactone hydrolase family protein [Acidimicrobiales bacterium]